MFRLWIRKLHSLRSIVECNYIDNTILTQPIVLLYHFVFVVGFFFPSKQWILGARRNQFLEINTGWFNLKRNAANPSSLFENTVILKWRSLVKSNHWARLIIMKSFKRKGKICFASCDPLRHENYSIKLWKFYFIFQELSKRILP